MLRLNNQTGKTFMVDIQLGAILAVCREYRLRLVVVLGGVASEAQARRFVTHHSFAVFAFYRIGFGALLLWFMNR